MINKKYKVALFILLALIAVVALTVFLHDKNVAILNPKGVIADKERGLMIIAAVLGLIVILPVFAMTAIIAWRYRESNTKAKYSPELDGNKFAELTWWAIPSVIIFTLSIIAWNSAHALDPYKPLASNTKPLNIQVVALNWKWLFIYPEQNIASVNHLQIPVNRPINFRITADAPMNSFWIPQLSGQIYAMPGMSTQLHLQANQSGTFNGFAANISGKGFAGMTFKTKSTSQKYFKRWIRKVKRSSNQLSQSSYDQLARPSEYNKPKYYSSIQNGLYDEIMMKYMMPMNTLNHNSMNDTPNNYQTDSSSTDMNHMHMHGMRM